MSRTDHRSAFLSACLLSLLLVLSRCTENPLFTGDDILPGNSKISGQVSLGLDSPENVVVWLEGFDLLTRTDSEGKFEMTLPVPAQQPDQGLTGSFNLYFYVANYRLVTRSIVVLDGYVEDGKGSISEEGAITEVISLEKMLTLFTDLEPDKINRNYQGNITCTITVTAVRDSVQVIAHMSNSVLTAGFIVPRPGTTYNIVPYERIPEVPILCEITTEGTVWEYTVEAINTLVGDGDYEVVPYIVVLQPFIPPGLMNRLGSNALEFDPAYLDVPFKRSGGLLFISSTGTN
jgi:hypothetical protein